MPTVAATLDNNTQIKAQFGCKMTLVWGNFGLVGDRDPEVIRINLFDIGQKYAEVENFDKIATLLKSQRSAG